MCLRVVLAVVCAGLGLFAALVLAIALWLATARAGGAPNGPVFSRSGGKRIVTKGGENH